MTARLAACQRRRHAQIVQRIDNATGDRRNEQGTGDGGGAEGNRTPDLLIANEALSQLSYSPVTGSAAP